MAWSFISCNFTRSTYLLKPKRLKKKKKSAAAVCQFRTSKSSQWGAPRCMLITGLVHLTWIRYIQIWPREIILCGAHLQSTLECYPTRTNPVIGMAASRWAPQQSSAVKPKFPTFGSRILIFTSTNFLPKTRKQPSYNTSNKKKKKP